jgi:hypothetical protein
VKCGPCPIFASYTLAFALQLRKKHGKTSARVEHNQNINQTPGKHPKLDTLNIEHGESLKSRIIHLYGEETHQENQTAICIYFPSPLQRPEHHTSVLTIQTPHPFPSGQ